MKDGFFKVISRQSVEEELQIQLAEARAKLHAAYMCLGAIAVMVTFMLVMIILESLWRW